MWIASTQNGDWQYRVFPGIFPLPAKWRQSVFPSANEIHSLAVTSFGDLINFPRLPRATWNLKMIRFGKITGNHVSSFVMVRYYQPTWMTSRQLYKNCFSSTHYFYLFLFKRCVPVEISNIPMARKQRFWVWTLLSFPSNFLNFQIIQKIQGGIYLHNLDSLPSRRSTHLLLWTSSCLSILNLTIPTPALSFL